MLLALDHPAQHFSAAFRRAALSTAVDLSVLYWRGAVDEYDSGFGRRVLWDADLMTGYRSEQVEPSSRRGACAVLRVLDRLDRLDADLLVVYGWSTAIARIATGWALVRRRPLLFYGDSSWQHSARPLLRLPRAGILRCLFTVAAGALSTGTFNREFYIRYGMHPSKIHDGVCPIDISAYSGARGSRSDHRTTVIGFAGKLITRKGVDELLQALALIPSDLDWVAHIIGDGPQYEELARLSTSLGIEARVRFLGFRNTSSMPQELAGCDVVVVPSRSDLRVLVTAEAMAAGAAVVVSSSTAVWGRGDLVEDGVTGCVYTGGDPAALGRVLVRLIEDRSLRSRLSAAGAERARGQGPEAFATSLEEAVTATLAARRHPASRR